MELNKLLISVFAKFKFLTDSALLMTYVLIGFFLAAQVSVSIYRMGGMMGTMTKKFEAELKDVCKATTGCVNVNFEPSYYTWDKRRGLFPLSALTTVNVQHTAKISKDDVKSIFQDKLVAAGAIAYKINTSI